MVCHVGCVDASIQNDVKFQTVKAKMMLVNDDVGYDTGRICGAFFLGLSQFSVAIIIEFLVIIFLLT